MVWATKPNLEFLSSSELLQLNGTFAICPKSFYQSYTIHAGVGSHKALPIVYSLFPDKKKSTYKQLELELL